MMRTAAGLVCVAAAIADQPVPEQKEEFLRKKEEPKAAEVAVQPASVVQTTDGDGVTTGTSVETEGAKIETKAKPNSDTTSTTITVKPGTKIEVTVENKDGATTTKLRDSSGAETTTLTNTESSKQTPLSEDIKKNGDIVKAPPPSTATTPAATEEEEPTSYIGKFISWAFMLKLAAIISNIITQLSPLRIIGEVRVNKSTGNQDSLPFLMIAVCGAQWCFYGLFAWWVTANQGFVIVVYANVLGVILGAWYTWSFMKYCIDVQRSAALQLYLVAATALSVFQIGVLGVFKPEKALLITGCVAAVMSVLVTASPLFDLHTVFATRSTKCWPGDLIIASFVSNVLWICCGIMLYDFWILFPNVIGLVTGGGQLYILYKFADPEIADGETKPLIRAKSQLKVLTKHAKVGKAAWTPDEESPAVKSESSAGRDVALESTIESTTASSSNDIIADGTGGS